MSESTGNVDSLPVSISFGVKAFKKALDLVSKVIHKQSFKPILRMVRLATGPDGAFLEATDLERAIKVMVQCGPLPTGSVMIDPEKTKGFLKTIGVDRAAIYERPDHVAIVTEHSRCEMPIDPNQTPDLFPTAPQWDDKASLVSIDPSDMVANYDRTAYATDPDSTRYALGGMLVEFANDGTGICVTADGRRLARRTFDCDRTPRSGRELASSLMIPVSTFKMVRDACKYDPQSVEIQSGPDKSMLFRIGEATIYSRTFEGRFPRYQDVFPNVHDIAMTLDADELLEVATQAAATNIEATRKPSTDGQYALDLVVTDSALMIETERNRRIAYTRRLDVKAEGPARYVHLDSRYVLDLVKSLGKRSGDLTVKLIDDRNPVVFTAEDGRLTSVIMPLNGREKDESKKCPVSKRGLAMLARLNGTVEVKADPAPTVESTILRSAACSTVDRDDVKPLGPVKAETPDPVFPNPTVEAPTPPENFSGSQVKDRETKLAKLARIKNRSTAYELAIVRGSERYLVCYSRRGKTRTSLNDAVCNPGARARMLVAFTGSESITFGKKSADPATMGEWSIQWTGRTEYQAINEGELTHFTDATSPVSFPEPAVESPQAHTTPVVCDVEPIATHNPAPISGGSDESESFEPADIETARERAERADIGASGDLDDRRIKAAFLRTVYADFNPNRLVSFIYRFNQENDKARLAVFLHNRKVKLLPSRDLPPISGGSPEAITADEVLAPEVVEFEDIQPEPEQAPENFFDAYFANVRPEETWADHRERAERLTVQAPALIYRDRMIGYTERDLSELWVSMVVEIACDPLLCPDGDLKRAYDAAEDAWDRMSESGQESFVEWAEAIGYRPYGDDMANPAESWLWFIKDVLEGFPISTSEGPDDDTDSDDATDTRTDNEDNGLDHASRVPAGHTGHHRCSQVASPLPLVGGLAVHPGPAGDPAPLACGFDGIRPTQGLRLEPHIVQRFKGGFEFIPTTEPADLDPSSLVIVFHSIGHPFHQSDCSTFWSSNTPAPVFSGADHDASGCDRDHSLRLTGSGEKTARFGEPTRIGFRIRGDGWERESLGSQRSATENLRGPDILTIGGTPYGLSRASGGWDLCRADGTCYRVTLDQSGPSCDCGDFRYRRAGLDSLGCKHIQRLRAEGLLPRPAYTHDMLEF